MKWAACVLMMLGAQSANSAVAATSAPPQTSEMETLIWTLEHYLMMGEPPPGSDLESRAKNVRARWQRLQRELLIEPENSYLTGLRVDNPRAILGMGIQDYFERYDGAIVTEILPDSPAEQAGLRVRDVIVAWNGEQIDLLSAPARDLVERMSKVDPHSKIRLKVLRDGRFKEFEIDAASGEAFVRRALERPSPGPRCVTTIAEPWLSGATDTEVLRSRKPMLQAKRDCGPAYTSRSESDATN